jgi:ADP-ribosyl-[dinitrogen reductase] hydrolase
MTQEHVQPHPLLGLAIGDALGKPFESVEGKPLPPKPSPDWNLDYLPGREEIVGEYGVPPGHFTDDTQMSWALATSLLAKDHYSRSDALRTYFQWSRQTGTRALRGMGGTIKRALDHVDAKGYAAALDDLSESGVRHRAHPCSPVDPMNDLYVGCGTAMRAAPLGAFFRTEQEIFKAATEDAYLTHASVEAAAGSFAVAWLVRWRLRAGVEPPRQVQKHFNDATSLWIRLRRHSPSVSCAGMCYTVLAFTIESKGLRTTIQPTWAMTRAARSTLSA